MSLSIAQFACARQTPHPPATHPAPKTGRCNPKRDLPVQTGWRFAHPAPRPVSLARWPSREPPCADAAACRRAVQWLQNAQRGPCLPELGAVPATPRRCRRRAAHAQGHRGSAKPARATGACLARDGAAQATVRASPAQKSAKKVLLETCSRFRHPWRAGLASSVLHEKYAKANPGGNRAADQRCAPPPPGRCPPAPRGLASGIAGKMRCPEIRR